MESLPLFHRIAGQPVIVLGDGEAAEAKRRLVARAGGVIHRDIAAGLAAGARLGFVALAREAVCAEAAAELRAAGVLVNVTDRPALCDFTVPAILDRDPVLVAVGTGGASAGLAKALRLRLEALLPESLGALARALAAGREALRRRLPAAEDRRRALDAALGEGGALDPLREDSAAAVSAWLAGAGVDEVSRVAEIHLLSADPEDLTLRAARLLGAADVVAHEAGVPEAVLIRARADAVRREIGRGEAVAVSPGLTVVLRVWEEK